MERCLSIQDTLFWGVMLRSLVRDVPSLGCFAFKIVKDAAGSCA